MEEIIEQKSDNEQINQNEENNYGQVMTSSTCHNFTSFNQDESNKENKLFKNKSESDLVLDKNKLNKIYLPAEDTMDLEQSFKESTGKKYSSSWFYGDSSKNPYPTIEEQVKLCRKIASQLVDDENSKSKGASMFFKRVKRSQKWIHEGFGTKNNNNSSTNSSQTADEEVEKLKRNLKLEAMPKLKLVLDPREILSLEKLRKTGDIVEHNIVSPDVCHNLVKDLNSPEINKGAAIFLKRKEKSSEWVVDENSTVVKIREQKREQELKKREEENVQKEWLMKKQKEHETVENDFRNNFNQELRELKNELNFDLNASQQFNQQTIKPQQINSITKYNSNLSKPISKFEDNCQNVSQTNGSVKHNLQQNQFLKLNFKNFNKVTRPWGITSDEYEKQLRKIQEEQDYKINLTTYPIDYKSISQPKNFDQAIKQNNPINNRTQQPIIFDQTIKQNNVINNRTQQPITFDQTVKQNDVINKTHQPITFDQTIKQNNVINNQPTYSSPNYNRTQNTNLTYQPQKQITKPMYSHNQLDYKRQIDPKIKNPHLNLYQTNSSLSNSQNAYKKQFHNNVTNLDNTINKPIDNKLEYSPFKNITHYNSSANFNNYIFNKLSNQQPNFEEMIKNENHNSYFNQPSSIYSNTNQNFNHFNNQQYENSIKNFDLTKLNIPSASSSIPKFKDFNAKPKLFMRC